MRFKITLEKTPGPAVIPLNYQYELSAWIYQIISKADQEYASFLHNQGYKSNQKTFKHFTFSNLHVPPQFHIRGDRMEIHSPKVYLLISFLMDKASEEFIKGLFMEQHLGLGDRYSQADFNVTQVEVSPMPLFKKTMQYRTLSPMMVAQKSTLNEHDDYLSPEDTPFEERFIMNLLDKYQATGQAIPPDWQDFPFQLRALTRPKEKLISIKAHTTQESKIKGYMFDFELTAPEALHETGYLAGFGRSNAEGFGCVGVVV